MTKVKVYEKDEVMIDCSLGPLNPHPAFPQWSVYDVYPYQFMGNVRYRELKKTFRMVYIENEFLKVCIAPDIGGRVWFIYDKISNRHAINHSSKVITYNAGFGLNYTCAGLEVNYPLAHSCTTSRKREYRILKNSDGSASVIIGEYEQIWRTRWFIRYTLRPGRSFLEQTVRIYNRSLHDSRYMYWSNCGFTVNDETQFIFPERSGSMHGKETTKLSWPIWKQRDISYWKNVIEPLGLYMLEAQEPYFGYYDYGADYGFVHYADLSDLPGKKYWSWGSGFKGRVSNPRTHHSDGKPYGEMQAGRIVIQEHLDRMPPETESVWTEYWYPVRDTQGFNGAGRDAALNLRVVKSADGRTELSVKTIGSGTFPDTTLIITCGSNKPIEKKVSISPISARELRLRLPYRLADNDVLSAKIVNKDGEILGKAHVERIPGKDSWNEVLSIQEGAKPKSAEEIFMEGESLARDWFTHDECATYEEALRIDPGLSDAHLEIGKIHTFRGMYESAISHLKKAIERNPGNLDSYYSLGVALILSGRTEEALHYLQLSSRYDLEGRSRTRLGEIKIRENDIHGALRYMERVTGSSPKLTRPLTLKAICLRLLGRDKEASDTIKKAREIDPMDPFLQFEEILVAREENRKSMRKSVRELISQLREYEPPYFEGILDYGNLHLYRDALDLLKLFPNKGPIAMVYQAFLEYKSGMTCYKKTLDTVCTLEPANHCVWQLEMIPVLEWAMKVKPDNPGLYYHLGNLFVARRQIEKGISMWRKAEALGDDNYLLYSNLGYYEYKVKKNYAGALKYFQKANKLEPEDPYMKIEIFNLLVVTGKKKEAIGFVEKHVDFVKTYPKIAFLLLSEYVNQKEYKKFDKMISGLNFKNNWPIAGPDSVWTTRYVNEALDNMDFGKYRKALELFNKSLSIPARLGMFIIEADKQERLFYHMGKCYEMMGKPDKAREMWEKAVRINREYAWERAYAYSTWIQRYFQALCFKKLGRESEANMIFDAMELMVKDQELPEAGRKYLMELVGRGRFAKEREKDPYMKRVEEVATTAEL